VLNAAAVVTVADSETVEATRRRTTTCRPDALEVYDVMVKPMVRVLLTDLAIDR